MAYNMWTVPKLHSVLMTILVHHARKRQLTAISINQHIKCRHQKGRGNGGVNLDTFQVWTRCPNYAGLSLGMGIKRAKLPMDDCQLSTIIFKYFNTGATNGPGTLDPSGARGFIHCILWCSCC